MYRLYTYIHLSRHQTNLNCINQKHILSNYQKSVGFFMQLQNICNTHQFTKEIPATFRQIKNADTSVHERTEQLSWWNDHS